LKDFLVEIEDLEAAPIAAISTDFRFTADQVRIVGTRLRGKGLGDAHDKTAWLVRCGDVEN
jgi:hypothetical protein